MLGAYGLRTYIWNNRLKSLAAARRLSRPAPPHLLRLRPRHLGARRSRRRPGHRRRGRPHADAHPGRRRRRAGLVRHRLVRQPEDHRRRHRRPQRSTARAEPRLWNLLENLCISRGITMPTLRIIETDARNAFASGVRKNQYSITVTRGLIDALDDAELEAVLAHELTHIGNRDVQLLVIAAVFVGIISLVGDLIIRGPRAALRRRRAAAAAAAAGGGGGSSSRGRGEQRRRRRHHPYPDRRRDLHSRPRSSPSPSASPCRASANISPTPARSS